MTGDLVAFLRARLDEDAADAQAAAQASSPDWNPSDEHLGDAVIEEKTGAAVVIGPYEYLDWGVRRHVARWDPARVLAEVQAKRRILDECGWAVKNGGGRAFVLPVLGCLALPYRNHKDYQPEWAPDA